MLEDLLPVTVTSRLINCYYDACPQIHRLKKSSFLSWEKALIVRHSNNLSHEWAEHNVGKRNPVGNATLVVIIHEKE